MNKNKTLKRFKKTCLLYKVSNVTTIKPNITECQHKFVFQWRFFKYCTDVLTVNFFSVFEIKI